MAAQWQSDVGVAVGVGASEGVALSDGEGLAVAVGDADDVGSPLGEGAEQVGDGDPEGDGDADPDGDGLPLGDADGCALVGVADGVGLAVAGVDVGDGWAVRVGLAVGLGDFDVGRVLGDGVLVESLPGLILLFPPRPLSSLLSSPLLRLGDAGFAPAGLDPPVGPVALGPGSVPVCWK